MHFQIFIPGVCGSSPEHLVQVGLEALTTRAQFLDVVTGPDKQPGVLVGWIGGRTRSIGYHADRQTWVPAIAHNGLAPGRYWFGTWNEAPPTPEDLQREYPYPGATVKLGDGRNWLLPRAHELPSDMVRADDGTWRFEVQRRFYAFWLESLDWHRRLMELGSGGSVRMVEVAEFVERALGINYRMTPEVVNHLRLFTSRDSGTVAQALEALMQIVAPADAGGAG